MKNLNAVTLSLGLSLSLYAFEGQAVNLSEVSRYVTVDNKPLASQVNPLLTVQQIHFPQQVHTVGEALNYWLQYSGFSIASDAQLPLPLKDVLAQALPQVDRQLGPLTVQDGLEVLVGSQVFSLVQDPLHRKVSFKLKPQYAGLFNKAQAKGGRG